MLEVSLRHSANQELIDSLEKEVASAVKDKDTEVSSTIRNKFFHKVDIMNELFQSYYPPPPPCFHSFYVSHSYLDLHVE